MNSKTMKQYVIDAFTDHVFAGNPAAVCVMDAWLPEDTMMAITRENNLSETAFAVKEGDKYHLRWFTPGGDIDRGVPEVWGSKYDVRELLRACYYAIDKKPISEAPLSFAEKEMLKIAIKKIKGTDIEILLKESGLIE